MTQKDWDQLANEIDYHNEVLSPFRYKSTSSIIFREIKKAAGKKKCAIDIGCGLGYLLRFLSGYFREVSGVDISAEMIRESMKKNPDAEFFTGDMKTAFIKDRYDLAVAVNSFIFPKLSVALENLTALHSSLKRKGTFVGVFPSVESEIYGSRLIFLNCFKKTRDEEKAWKKTYSVSEMGTYDLFRGTYFNKSRQKFYYEAELGLLLKKAGFRKFRIKKLKYPWKAFHKTLRFDQEEKLWDWLVVAKK